MANHEVITRRLLPHWYMPGAPHFVTYRLYGSLPQQALEQMRSRKALLLRQRVSAGCSPRQHRERAHKQMFADYDQWLDRSYESHRRDGWLANPRVASLVRSNLYHHHGTKYHLMAYCVMPNHVHVLLQPIEPPVAQAARLSETPKTTGGPPMPRSTGGPPVPRERNLLIGEQSDTSSPLSQIMHSLKSYTAHEANKTLRRTGAFWQSESYDHWVRDEDELERIVDYICANPVQAGLVQRPQDWHCCSCQDRFQMDGDSSGWIRWEDGG